MAESTPAASAPCSGRGAARGAGLLVLLSLGTACRRAHSDGATPSAEPAERPSFVLVLVDDGAQSDLEAVRADGLGHNDLLAIDLLASVGQSWTNFCAQPTCNPTRSTLMNGRVTGASQGGVCNPPSASTPTPDATLATILRDTGYATAAFGKWHVARDPDPNVPWVDSPAVYGFDAWRAWNASNLLRHCGSKDYFDWHRVDDGVERQTIEYHTEAVGTAFLDWWQQTSGARRVYVCFQAPHAPIHEPPAHLLPAGYPTPTTNRESYAAMLVALDTMLASMLNVIDLRDTYVIVLGDNGTPPDAVRADQLRVRVKKSTYEDGVHVPMIVAGPGSFARRRPLRDRPAPELDRADPGPVRSERACARPRRVRSFGETRHDDSLRRDRDERAHDVRGARLSGRAREGDARAHRGVRPVRDGGGRDRDRVVLRPRARPARPLDAASSASTASSSARRG